jgi:hypothetical protein
MAMNRANMASQVMKPPMKKKLKKVSQKLKNASKAHAGQAKALKDVIGMKTGGSCRGMGAAKKGGKFTVS